MSLGAEGTVSFRLTVPEGYWRSQGESCRFPPIAAAGLYVEVAITAEHRLEVFADGPRSRAWTLSSAPLDHAPGTLALTLTWGASGVVLYLDGQPVACG